MGLRNGAYATVWEVNPASDTLTKVRMSISRKDKNTGDYVQDFSGWCYFYGTANAHKAANLKERDRIKVDGIDVSTSYDKEKKIGYTFFKVFSFEMADGENTKPAVDDGEPDIDDDDDLPF